MIKSPMISTPLLSLGREIQYESDILNIALTKVNISLTNQMRIRKRLTEIL